MIIEGIFNILFGFVEFIVGLIPALPDVPSWMSAAVDTSVYYIMVGMAFWGYFIPSQAMIGCCTISLTIVNWADIYALIIYVLKKIPFLSME